MTTQSASKAAFTRHTLDFMADLVNNNHREWFHANRSRYDAAKAELCGVVERVLLEMSAFEPLANTAVKDCIFRINRDIRFSKDKAPYKSNLAFAIGPGGRHSGRIDYYVQIQPGNQSFLGAGMWQPTPANLAKFRQEVDYNVGELKDIIEADAFRAYFPEVSGEVMKTSPKGYAADHPEIDLLRRKELFFIHRYTDKEVLKPNFANELVRGCQLLKPYCDLLNYLFFEEKEEPITL
ncbi:DUF2461 domain-containing protein [Spirosoma utsteinense]|uniref:TIGR02453 family protein n=1 Tax=Spirosoma utsteinense TaxID=2585773 RepID=A0ABR6W6A4_9BACT|nr:DUF2461 domain-containing protein [Spirosoma utsteinense]MBC3785942.1 putative protein (TIGR02453 family) [Spirosoma utsteinense]MBC3792112.1 putative protein (TIGR02453 family) [Spirosoma utsteinense]